MSAAIAAAVAAVQQVVFSQHKQPVVVDVVIQTLFQL